MDGAGRGRHAPAGQAGLDQLHGDAAQRRGGRPDDAVAVEEGHVPDRPLGDEPVAVEEQRVVEAGLAQAGQDALAVDLAAEQLARVTGQAFEVQVQPPDPAVPQLHEVKWP